MVSEKKKAYMRQYNQKPEIKFKKAEYMRKLRVDEDELSARALVTSLLDLGYEDLAYEYALERAPEMLVTAKSKARQKASTRKPF